MPFPGVAPDLHFFFLSYAPASLADPESFGRCPECLAENRRISEKANGENRKSSGRKLEKFAIEGQMKKGKFEKGMDTMLTS